MLITCRPVKNLYIEQWVIISFVMCYYGTGAKISIKNILNSCSQDCKQKCYGLYFFGEDQLALFAFSREGVASELSDVTSESIRVCVPDGREKDTTPDVKHKLIEEEEAQYGLVS